ncbi:MAG: hypothetical protein AB1758_30635, partial [Candidatus Eremiobacterota bacterium]
MQPRLPPPITRVLNLALRHEPDPAALMACLPEASRCLEELARRLDRVFPLVAHLEEAAESRSRLEGAIRSFKEALGGLALAISTQPSDLLHVTSELDARACSLSEAISRLQAQQEAGVQTFCDVPILNELFNLSFSLLQGKTRGTRALRQRLPDLLGFTRSLDASLGHLAATRPDEKELLAELGAAVEDLKLAAGGFFVFTESGQPEDLSNALSLLERSTRRLSPCLEALHMVEDETFSPELRLEELKAGADREAFARAVEQLRRDHRLLSQDMERVREAFMPFQRRERLLETLSELSLAMQESLAALERPESTPEVLERELQRYRRLYSQVDRLVEPPDIGLDWDFLALVGGAFEGTVPDVALRESVLRLRMLRESLRRSAPDSPAVGYLDGQEQGLSLVVGYLDSGDRDLLCRAADLLAPPEGALPPCDSGGHAG